MKSLTLGFLAVLCTAALDVTAQSAPAPTAAQVASALQQKYDTVRDFSADFTHRHEGGVLRRTLVERGTLLVKKPGRMRWHYRSPEEKLFISDGKRIYFHDPANNQVTISEMPEADQAATAALFLIGKGHLGRDFRAAFLPDAPAGSYGLRLDPKQPQTEYDWLELVVDQKSLQIRSLTAADNEGTRSTFLFSNFKENVGLADRSFEFTPPRGAEIIHAGRAKG